MQVASSSDIPKYLVVEHAPDNPKIRGRYSEPLSADTAIDGLAKGSPGVFFSRYSLDYTSREMPHEWKVGDIGRLTASFGYQGVYRDDLVEVTDISNEHKTATIKSRHGLTTVPQQFLAFVARPA